MKLQIVLAAAIWSACSTTLFAQTQTAPASAEGPGAPGVAGGRGGGGGGRGGAGGIPADAPADPEAKPVFKDGMAQIVPGFGGSSTWIHQDLWVETEFDTDNDGKKDRVHVDVTRPSQTDHGLKLPVIYHSSPYFAGTAGGRSLWPMDHEVDTPQTSRQHGQPINVRNTHPVISSDENAKWIPRGFISVHSEAPGSGLSTGIITVGGDPECLAPKAVIDWLNGRAKGFTTVDGNEPVVATWTTGKVGMTGTSYDGTLPVAAACTGVKGLECIIPIAPNTSYYHYYRTNGLVRSPGGWLGEDIDFLFDFINSGNTLAMVKDPVKQKYAIDFMRDGEMARGQDRATGDYNEFWASRDLLPRVGNIKCAVLMAHAFNDWNVVPEHSIRIWQAIKDKVPSQLYMHQGGHGGNPPIDMEVKWYSRYLFDQQNGVENDPKAWIVREGASPQQPTPYKSYPNPDAAPVTLHIGGDGLKVGSLATATAAGGKETLVDDASITSTQLARAAESNNRLLFATPKLSQPVHLSGYTTITIKVACSKPAANLSVYLVPLGTATGAAADAPGGAAPGAGRGGRGGRGGAGGSMTDTLITRGWADIQNYKALTKDAPLDYHSMVKGEPLVPGQFYELTFALEPDDQIIPAGKQIGLMIMSSDNEFTMHPKPGTELTVDLAGTTVNLPVVGGANALNEATKQ